MRRSLLLLLVGGCAPVLPFHFAETAETLTKKSVSVTVSGGGGGGNVGGGGGASARVDVGVGHDQQVGGEFSAMGTVGAAYLGGKLRYKLGLNDRLALVAGSGVTGTVNVDTGKVTGPAAGADLALVTSTRPNRKGARLYGGLRFSFVVPLARDVYSSSVGGPAQVFVLPIGGAIPLSDRWRVFLEAGLVCGASEYNVEGRWVQALVGGYGAIALAWDNAR
jgi:hypothetical protein